MFSLTFIYLTHSVNSAGIGLHSGPVTAGVLRGKRSRFQLFGDSVNTGKRPMCIFYCITNQVTGLSVSDGEHRPG